MPSPSTQFPAQPAARSQTAAPLPNSSAAARPSAIAPGSGSLWLRWFAVLTAVATLGLVGVGGLVTSHGVGMAVPDWPNTYGYNMFFFPVSRWVGGIFYEHTHRLWASGVGLLTTILALWLYGHRARPWLRWGGLGLALVGMGSALASPHHWADGVVLAAAGLAALSASSVWPRCEPSPKWLRRLGLVAFFGVILQGVLGGLRVVLLRDELGIFHATLAQLFFCLVCALALFTSRWWQALPPAHFGRWRLMFVAGTGLVLLQLVLGATMRHQHAGLAIPDFPLAYGRVWPEMDADSIARYNARRIEVTAVNPITATQVGLQMAHRGLALLILVTVGASVWLARRRLGPQAALTRLAGVWLGLILLQVLLGAATLWSNKAADVATAHVLTGALSLAVGVIASLISMKQAAVLRTAGSHVPAHSLWPAAAFETARSAMIGENH